MGAIRMAVAVAALAAMTACEKAEDRAAANLLPNFNIEFCASEGIDSPSHLGTSSCILSKNKAYVLLMQASGALKLAKVTPAGAAGEVSWTTASRSSSSGSAAAYFQDDGNLVIYDGQKPIWDSHSSGKAGRYRLGVNDNGSLTIRDANGTTIWSTQVDARLCPKGLDSPAAMGPGGCLASPLNRYVMVLEPSGVIRIATAASNGMIDETVLTIGNPPAAAGGAFLALQADGNLVIYVGGLATWSSQTNGRQGGIHLELSDQGELRLHDQAGAVIWTSKNLTAKG